MITLDKHIWLCGFMGCGKSTVGKQLASLLNVPFVDMDSLIEEQEGRSIPAIFAQEGEPYFRKIEAKAVVDLQQSPPSVIATGGGVMVSPENATAAKMSGCVVFLDLAFDRCYERICHSDRPIVRQNTPDQLREIYETRRTLYLAHADYRLDDPETSDQAVQELMKIIAKNH